MLVVKKKEKKEKKRKACKFGAGCKTVHRTEKWYKCYVKWKGKEQRCYKQKIEHPQELLRQVISER